MKNVYFSFKKSLSRRTILKGTGAAMALPWLEAMSPAFASTAASAQAPRRFVSVSLGLGLHGPNLNPVDSGFNYTPSIYLKQIEDLLGDLTIVSGSSHPRVSGGHNAEACILSAAPYKRNAAFKNSISIDQLMANHLGHHTRYPSLVLSTSGNNSPSYTATGSMIPAEDSPSRLFAKLFVDDTPTAKQLQVKRLKQGQSIMDIVADDAKKLQRELGVGDKDKMDQYFTSVRNFEQRLRESEDWAHHPKPKVTMEQPTDIRDGAEFTRKQLMLDVMFMAIQTDSTRFLTLHTGKGYHGLSHHGLDEDKIAQLTIVESDFVKTWGNFVRRLKQTPEGDGNLLDQTNVLLTSNLGNASSHDNKNMPVLFAGGGFRHGQHLAFDTKDNYPLPNLYLSALQRQGIEVESFATSTGTMSGLEIA